MQIQERRIPPHPHSLVLFEQIPIAPILFWSNARLFPSLHSHLWPCRFAFQTSSPHNLPARYTDPVLWLALRFSRPPVSPAGSCGSGALSSSPWEEICKPPLQVDWLSKQLPARAPDSGRCWTLPEGATGHTEQAMWQSSPQTGGKKTKTNPTQTLPPIAPESSRQAQPRTLKCAVYFLRTAFSFLWHELPSLQSSGFSTPKSKGSQSPGGKAMSQTQITGLFSVHVNSVQPRNSHLILLLSSTLLPLCYHSLVKVKANKAYFYHLTESQFPFLIEINRLGHYLQWTVPFLCHTQHNIHENSDGREGNPHYIRVWNAPNIDNPSFVEICTARTMWAWHFLWSDYRGDSGFIHRPDPWLRGAPWWLSLSSPPQRTCTVVRGCMLPSRDWACWGYASGICRRCKYIWCTGYQINEASYSCLL